MLTCCSVQCGLTDPACALLLLLQVSSPYEVAEFDIMYGEGINSVGCVYDVAKEMGVIEARVSTAQYQMMRDVMELVCVAFLN